MNYWKIRFEFKKEDAWIGIFWKKRNDPNYRRLDVWVCAIPYLPLHFWKVNYD